MGVGDALGRQGPCSSGPFYGVPPGFSHSRGVWWTSALYCPVRGGDREYRERTKWGKFEGSTRRIASWHILTLFPYVLRFSVRVNTTDLFHVDLRYWSTLRAKDSHRGPRERAFHSATVIGNYMVVYGECSFIPGFPSSD